MMFDLEYPRGLSKTEIAEQKFTDILENSINRKQITSAWSDTAKKFQQATQTRHVTRLPEVLVLDCAIHDSESESFWAEKNEQAWKDHTGDELGV